MTHNPRTYIQQLAAEAADIVGQLGEGWSHEGAIITHNPSGAKVLLLTQVAVAPDNALRINLEGMSTAQIVAAAREVTPRTYWLVEYDSDGSWSPTYYSEFETVELAQSYCDTFDNGEDDDLRISKVTVQTVKLIAR